jgi:hypothetical protein
MKLWSLFRYWSCVYWLLFHLLWVIIYLQWLLYAFYLSRSGLVCVTCALIAVRHLAPAQQIHFYYTESLFNSLLWNKIISKIPALGREAVYSYCCVGGIYRVTPCVLVQISLSYPKHMDSFSGTLAIMHKPMRRHIPVKWHRHQHR